MTYPRTMNNNTATRKGLCLHIQHSLINKSPLLVTDKQDGGMFEPKRQNHAAETMRAIKSLNTKEAAKTLGYNSTNKYNSLKFQPEPEQ